MQQAVRPADSRNNASTLELFGTVALGLYLIIVAVILVSLLVQLWPIIEGVQQSGTSSQELVILWGAISFSVSPDTSFLLLVIVASAIGSFIHAATSFATYVGNGDLGLSWFWWYLLRIFIGIALALLFYFAVRGGFFAQDATSAEVNPYGIAALAGLTGLFSKQATDKLREVFDTLFRTAPGTGDEERKDKLSNPVPTLEELEPSTLPSGEASHQIRVTGTGFIEAALVRVDGIDRPTRFVSATELDATLGAEDLGSVGELEVTVFNPPPGGGTSNPLRLTVQ
jgi:hypothetical protein